MPFVSIPKIPIQLSLYSLIKIRLISVIYFYIKEKRLHPELFASVRLMHASDPLYQAYSAFVEEAKET